ncbi:MAG: polyprenyl synthetase family protein [Methylococcaceae bacterium]|nr:polyprenyl synthetase family protein [Methylococcaceae bacterium]
MYVPGRLVKLVRYGAGRLPPGIFAIAASLFLSTVMNVFRENDNLVLYLDAVNAFIESTIRQAGLLKEQVELLCPKPRQKQSATRKILAHPLAPFYFVVRAHGVPVTGDAEAIGAGFLMFHHALALIDDVQDDELTGPYAALGGGVAINCGLTLFFLALDILWAAEREGRANLGWDLHSALHLHAIRLSRGQHRDLTGRGSFRSPAEAIEIATEKSAISTLLMEYAAACAAPSGLRTAREPYRVIGNALTKIKQITDDVADLFGKSHSQDLRTGTQSVPLTLLLHTVPEDARAQWAARLCETDQRELCRLLYEMDVMQELAAITEAARIRIHQTFAELPCEGPYLAMFLAWLDDLTCIFYQPDVLNVSNDMDEVDTSSLHPEDAILFEQLRAAQHAAQQKRRSALS